MTPAELVELFTHADIDGVGMTEPLSDYLSSSIGSLTIRFRWLDGSTRTVRLSTADDMIYIEEANDTP